MSTYYRPDNDASAGDPWNTAFLSDRDVSGQVPINYVPHPGVYLTPACFGNGTYEDDSFEECFSNLLASEFRRFVVDVYWDVQSRQYRLCPVELPARSGNGTAQVLQAPRFTTTLAQMAVMSAAPLSARQATVTNINSTTSSAQNSTTNSTSQLATTTRTSSVAVSTSVSQSGNVLYQVGPYQCTATITLDLLLSILGQYISQTSTTLQARLQFLIINLHTANTLGAPTTARQSLSQAELPNSNELIHNYLSDIESTLYTPSLLNTERENLNTSWFARRTPDYFPLLNYFITRTLSNGDLATPDGWPNENYVQLESGYRLLAGYGTVESSISNYNFTGDSATIFRPGSLTSQINAIIDPSGNLASGCFYSSTEFQVAQVNSSWAVSSVMDIDQSILGYAADNLTSCGISPILNYTLDNRPASTNYGPYQSFGNQALFSWASGEPKNATAAGQNPNSVLWSCALMVSNDEYRGHWRVADCQRRYRVACREANQPYLWRLSSQSVPYEDGAEYCTGNTSFDVPRTGLENTYLYQHIRGVATSQQDQSLLDGVWVNFNDLAFESCWVTTGVNGTCPYYEDPAVVRQRTILVPTVAALITLCITALTILVKCNTNRRKSKVRRRGEGGWDYEGVPS